MVQFTCLSALVSSFSLAIISSQLSSSTNNNALAFAPSSPTTLTPNTAISFNSKRLRTAVLEGNNPSRLFYQAGTTEQETTTTTASTTDDTTETIIPHINDSTHQSILHNTNGIPVLVDCTSAKCGPCKLIEKSLQSILPKYTTTETETEDQQQQQQQELLSFCKWDVEEKENSVQFMNLLQDHEMTFRKLPTLLLFVDGVPVAMRGGMATPGQIDRFLEDHLPSSRRADDNNDEEEVCVNEITLDGEKFLCE